MYSPWGHKELDTTDSLSLLRSNLSAVFSSPFDVSQESPVTPQNHLAEETAAVKETRLRQGRFTLTQSHSGWVKLSKASVTFCPSLRTRLASQRTQVTSSI